MSFERPSHHESTDSLSPEKRELLDLERAGNFVFHGTGAEVESLEPRQAIDSVRGPDGEPGVFASPAVDRAIFHAIINKRNFPDGIRSRSGATSDDDGNYVLNFALPAGALERLPDSANGWIYVFNKTDFDPIEGRPAELKSHNAIRPIKKILVSKRDLPKGIETF